MIVISSSIASYIFHKESPKNVEKQKFEIYPVPQSLGLLQRMVREKRFLVSLDLIYHSLGDVTRTFDDARIGV